VLPRQEARGRHRAREHVPFFDRDAHVLELELDVAPRALTVVGQKQERIFLVQQARDQLGGAANRLPAAVDDAVHVDQETGFG